MFDFVGQILRSVLRLVLLLAAGVFALSLLSAVLVAVLLTALWSLLTGRKPAVFTTFTRFRQASRQFRQGAWSPQSGAHFGTAAPADVVDVQAHEVGERTVRANLPLEHEPKA
ncbi:MAG: hypothetical protein KGN32_16180 [Burkholderiales bacterium]|nr:hypothetical protein [Burkholderiales bacterium]